MKRFQRSMSTKRKRNYDEIQHVEKNYETLLYFLLLDEGEIVQPFFPLVHEVEEAIGLNDEEFEDIVETTLVSILLAHKDKEMVISVHIDGIMNENLDMVDEHIDTFIQTGRRTWDFGHFIFYRNPIYDIEGISQEKGVELSSSKDWSSYVYDSYAWNISDDMVIDQFHLVEDELSPYTHNDFRSSL
jgi:hypothetical protein